MSQSPSATSRLTDTWQSLAADEDTLNVNERQPATNTKH